MLASKKQATSETFNSGVLNVLSAVDGVINSNILTGVNYGNRTVGASRFFNAESAGTEVTRMIAVPFNRMIKRGNILELHDFMDDEKHLFEIVQIQEKYDTAPACLYISLRRTSINYVDKRSD